MSKLISEQVILGWPTIVSESGSCHMAWTISLLQPLCFLEPPTWSHRHRHAGRHTQPISCPCHQYGKKLLLLLWQADCCLCISHWVKLVLSCMPSVNFSTKSGRFCWHSYENSDPSTHYHFPWTSGTWDVTKSRDGRAKGGLGFAWRLGELIWLCIKGYYKNKQNRRRQNCL